MKGSHKSKEEIILSTPLFKNITIDELGCLDNTHLTYKTYKKNEHITQKGTKANKIGLLLSGGALIVKENVFGDRMLMDILKEGHLFGEIGVFSDAGAWPATVIAESDTEVLFIDNALFVHQCVKNCSVHQKLIYNMLNLISNKAVKLNKKIEYLTIKNVRSKIATYILEQYKMQKALTITIPMNRNDWAEFLNITRPSLSRELAKMKDDSIIDYYKSTVKIKDLSKLQKC